MAFAKSAYSTTESRSNLNLEMMVFVEGGKPGEKRWEQGREPTINSTRI